MLGKHMLLEATFKNIQLNQESFHAPDTRPLPLADIQRGCLEWVQTAGFKTR